MFLNDESWAWLHLFSKKGGQEPLSSRQSRKSHSKSLADQPEILVASASPLLSRQTFHHITHDHSPSSLLPGGLHHRKHRHQRSTSPLHWRELKRAVTSSQYKRLFAILLAVLIGAQLSMMFLAPSASTDDLDVSQQLQTVMAANVRLAPTTPEELIEKQPVIEYYVHGHGRGHASRGQPIIASLVERGYYVCVFANENAAPMLDSVGSETHYVRTLEPHAIFSTVSTIASRVMIDADSSRCRRSVKQPDLIITDGDWPGLFRGWRSGIPVISLGHGVLFSSAERPENVSPTAWEEQRQLNSRISTRTQCSVAFSFVPLKVPGERTILAQPSLRAAVKSIPQERPRKRMVLAYFRDGQRAQHVIQALAKTDFEVRAFGDFEPIPGVEVYPFNTELFVQSLAQAAAVVGSSGMNLISECMHLNIPMLALYDADDSEQLLNAAMLQQSNKGMGVSFQDFSGSFFELFVSGMETMRTTEVTWKGMSALDAAHACIRQVYPLAAEWEAQYARQHRHKHRRTALAARPI